MLEKDVEKKVCDYAKSKGILVYKFSSPGHSAVPDRMFILPGGRTFFIEFKRLGCKPTIPQTREHTRLAIQGSKVHIIDSVDDGKYIIDCEVLRATSTPVT